MRSRKSNKILMPLVTKGIGILLLSLLIKFSTVTLNEHEHSFYYKQQSQLERSIRLLFREPQTKSVIVCNFFPVRDSSLESSRRALLRTIFELRICFGPAELRKTAQNLCKKVRADKLPPHKSPRYGIEHHEHIWDLNIPLKSALQDLPSELSLTGKSVEICK